MAASTTRRDILAEQYEQLPDSVRASYSLKEYRWIGDDRRARILDEECLPEVHED